MVVVIGRNFSCAASRSADGGGSVTAGGGVGGVASTVGSSDATPSETTLELAGLGTFIADLGGGRPERQRLVPTQFILQSGFGHFPT